MPKSNRLFTAALVLGGPGAAALAALIALDALAPGFGLAAILFVLAGAAAIAWRALSRLARMTGRLESLIDAAPEAEGEAPDEAGPIGDVAAALFRLERSWRRERRKLREDLHAARILFDALPDPLVTLDANARVVYANAAARALLGDRQGGGEPAGRDLSAVIRRPGILEAAAGVLDGEPARTAEFALADRVEQSFEARIEPIRADAGGGGDARALILMRDVTALRRGERMRADFVANVSHELRTPLTSLAGFVETLRGAARDDAQAQARFLDLMENQSTRMTRIVDDLLSLSRIEMNEHTRPSGEVHLKRTLATVADLLAPQAQARDVRVELALDALTRPVIGQSDELIQLFQNLIENAIKYGGTGSVVRVAAEVDADAARISVIDQGEGIAREHIPRLTERFYRVDTARSRELGGTGLGLAIVKHIVNRHRGELAIESEPGAGSAFTVTLRLAAAQPQAGAA